MLMLRICNVRCIVGRHKHLLMLKFQSEIHRRVGVWVPTPDLWARLGELYDLDALDAMVSQMLSFLNATD